MIFTDAFLRRIVLFALPIVLGTPVLSSAALAEGFDQPVKETHIDLGPSPGQPDYPNLHVHLSCWYYTDFMVKQLDDDGNKGALWVSITRLRPGHTAPCKRVHHPTEMTISNQWDYYLGVKGWLVFLLGADGLNGGLNFDVFDSRDGKKIFKDIVLELTTKFEEAFSFILDKTDRLSMTYMRVIYGHCSIQKDGTACWNKIERQIGLKNAQMPKCDYSQYPDDPGDPSVIFSLVKVDFYPQPKRRILSEFATCRAAE